MSWAFPPVGVAFAIERGAGSTAAPGNSTQTHECVISDDAGTIIVECPLNDAFAGSVALPYATALALLDAGGSFDWYTLGFRFDFGSCAPGLDVCTGLRISPCSRSEDYAASSSGGIGGISVVDSADGSSMTLSGASTLSGFGGGTTWTVPSPTPSRSMIVSPSPAYPVPDTFGNTAGEVLWTHAQVAAVSLAVSYSGDWSAVDDYVVSCWVRGYRNALSDEDAEGWWV